MSAGPQDIPLKSPSFSAGSPLLSGWLLVLAVFSLLALVYHPQGGWNVNTRLNLVFAVVNHGTLQIDLYHEVPPYATGDKAVFDGHFYSDKIVGVSALAVPFYGFARLLAGDSLSYEAGYFVSKLGAVALPGALAAGLFWLTAVRLGAPPRRAVILTGLLVAGTMWTGYGTVFFPYMMGLAVMLGALYVTLFPAAGRLTPLNCLGVGALMGAALLADLTFGLAVFGLGVIWLLRLLDQVGLFGQRAFAEMTGPRTRIRDAAMLAICFWAGVFLPLSLFFAYSYAIFGTLTIPYKYEASELFRVGMSQGFMGVQTPRLGVLGLITVHPYRGLFFWSPILLAGLVGCSLAMGHYGKRLYVGVLGWWCLIAYLLFNAGYYMWWGGWCMGPRFLIPVIPFIGLGLMELARADSMAVLKGRWQVAGWWSAIGLGLASVCLSLPLSLTDPQIPQGNPTEALILSDAPMPPLQVPQWAYWEAFFKGQTSLWPWDRLRGEIAADSRAEAFGSAAALLALFVGLMAAAWYFAPSKATGTTRADFPFRTIDGNAAPLPTDRKL